MEIRVKGKYLGKSKVDPTGRVYIPRAVQKLLNINPENREVYVSFVLHDGFICIHKTGIRIYQNNNNLEKGNNGNFNSD